MECQKGSKRALRHHQPAVALFTDRAETILQGELKRADWKSITQQRDDAIIDKQREDALPWEIDTVHIEGGISRLEAQTRNGRQRRHSRQVMSKKRQG